jgi:hypothetical protein
MKPDSMIVEPEYISSAGQQVVSEGAEKALNGLSEAEPALAAYVCHSLAAVAGKLALSGAPTPIIQGAHEEVLTLVLVSLQAMRRGHYELWKDTFEGPSAALPEQPLPAPKQRQRRRRRRPADNSDQ